jgi:hypothetical protein
MALAAVVGVAACAVATAQFPGANSTAYPLPPRPFIPDCSPNYPLPAEDVVFDWDTNCNMSVASPTGMLWTSKVGGHVANWTDALVSSRVLDMERGLARIVLPNGRKVILPYDISPSRHPDFTLELLASAAGMSASGTRHILTSEVAGTTVPAQRGRAVMVFDANGAGVGYAAWCNVSATSSQLPIGGGL